MKKNILKIGKKFLYMNLVVLIILAIFCFTLVAFAMFKDFFKVQHEINDTRQELFKQYQHHIDPKPYPKTYQEYLKVQKYLFKKDCEENLNKPNIDLFDKKYYISRYAKIQKGDKSILDYIVPSCEIFTFDKNEFGNYSITKTSLIKYLNPNPSKQKIIKSGLRYLGLDSDKRVYYDESGKLIYIEIVNSTMGDVAYRYDITGKFVETEEFCCKDNFIFNKDKKLKYVCFNDDCEEGEDNPITWILQWIGLSIFLTLALFCLCSIVTFPIFIIIQIIIMIYQCTT